MIALNMPMQPSSNTPMMAFCLARSSASLAPALRVALGTLTRPSLVTWRVAWVQRPVASHFSSRLRK